jgi:ribosomal RNA-processing protein 7
MNDHTLVTYFGFCAIIFWSIIQERKAKEALAAEGGWTVVEHHRGRKKTTDSESGIAVGSVAQAAVENKLARKKPKELGLDFYRFQKRDAQRNGMPYFS